LNLASLLAVVAAGATPWSAPAVLSTCAAGAAAQVVFPSDSPSHATGAGAIVWGAAPGCPGGEGARVAAIGAGDQPGAPAIPRTAAHRPIAPHGPLLAGGAPHGQIVIAGAAPGAATQGLLIQGAAAGPFTALAPAGGSATPAGGSAAPTALATAYLGDVALASAPERAGAGSTRGFDLRVERFFSHEFTRDLTVRVAAGAGLVRALTLAMDYRSEVLAAWVQGGAIYARLVPEHGAAGPLQRLAPAGARPHIAALLSDDRRAIVAWSEQHGAQTSVYIDRSGTGVRFRAPQLLESFADPDGLPAPAASPSLVRLSSESVMLAWAGSAAGHWVVRTAPVYLNGVGTVGTIAAREADAMLADLTAGPAADALVLWTEPSPSALGQPDMDSQAIFAARGFDAGQERTVFDPPEQVAPPAPVLGLSAAFDPSSDRAVAVWQGEADAIEYSVRTGAAAP
jgi:hypothetical protein